jgi:CO/xanthine dehydrogenase FAD-binding subunit
MKAASFEYLRAASTAEACAALREHGEGAKLLAGGQSLVPMMAMRLARPALLVDINHIASLKFVGPGADEVRVGACTRQIDLERDAALAARVPLLRQALAWVGHIQTRNRGTIGGSLAHADPAAELPLAAQTLGATMLLRSKEGTRSLPAAAFFTGPMSTALKADEILEEIRWPVWTGRRSGSAFSELSIRHGDFALVAAAAQIELGEDGRCVRACLGLGGVGATPIAFPGLAERLAGQQPDDALFDSIAAEAAMETDPWNDLHASADYRRHLAAVLAGRVLRGARDAAMARR